MKSNDQDGLNKLKELVEEVRICMLCTRHRDHINSKPMSTSKVDPNGDIWFFTDELTEKVEQVESNPQVCLAYSDPSRNTYLSISGTAGIVHDQNKLQELWNPVLKAWFPAGLDTPNVALLKVSPDHAEYWDSSSSKMVVFFNAVKAAVTGDRYDEGDHGKINL
ncbi:MAG TPA: pyridoxamine 5'-phosphate oxidase family protein [Sphingobacteriaceae bacterium]